MDAATFLLILVVPLAFIGRTVVQRDLTLNSKARIGWLFTIVKWFEAVADLLDQSVSFLVELSGLTASVSRHHGSTRHELVLVAHVSARKQTSPDRLHFEHSCENFGIETVFINWSVHLGLARLFRCVKVVLVSVARTAGLTHNN